MTFKAGDTVFLSISRGGGAYDSASKATVARVMSRFIELEDGSKYAADGSGFYPKPTGRFITTYARVVPWDESKHAPLVRRAPMLSTVRMLRMYAACVTADMLIADVALAAAVKKVIEAGKAAKP